MIASFYIKCLSNLVFLADLVYYLLGDFMDVLVTLLGVLGTISMIIAALIKGKNMKLILFFVFFGNVFAATSYLLGGSGINGAASCYIGGVQTLINYFFDSKNKPVPKWLVAIYALSFIGINVYVGAISSMKIYLVALAIVASLTFVMCIGQKSGARYRFWTLFNFILWGTYDALSGAWEVLVTVHVPLFVFTVAGMILHDRKKAE